jgi:prepilin-type processing-associated H-X9-DG protein
MINSSLINNGCFISPGSDHSGGAQMGYGDGSVRFVVNSVNPDVFALLGSMADGVTAEIIDAGG